MESLPLALSMVRGEPCIPHTNCGTYNCTSLGSFPLASSDICCGTGTIGLTLAHVSECCEYIPCVFRGSHLQYMYSTYIGMYSSMLLSSTSAPCMCSIYTSATYIRIFIVSLFSWRGPTGWNVLIYCMTSMLHELLKKNFSFTSDATMSLYNSTYK